MSKWLEGLSEEWEPQPHSESPEPAESTGNASQNTSSRSAKGTSRRRSVLRDRSLSEENIQLTSVRKNEDKAPRVGLSRRSLSAESAQFGTTARISSTKEPRQSDTPEWKRRLLKGKMGYGEQKDLFSATGIENIFQRPPPPPPRQPQQERTKGLSFLKSLELVPSSPPPWPSNAESPQQERSRFGTIGGQNLEALHEQEEDFSAGEHSQERDDRQHQNEPEDRPLPGGHELSFNELSFNESSLRDQHSFGTVRDVGTSRATSQALSLAFKGTSSRTVSKTFQSNGDSEDFSPVYISKHNTSDGRVDYAALDLSKSALADRLKQFAESQASHQPSEAKHDEAQDSRDISLTALEVENLPEDLSVGTPDLASIGDFVSIKRGGYSRDGSFRRRPLSPSPLARPISVATTEGSVIHYDVCEPSEAEVNHSVPPYAPTPPHHPTTPKRAGPGGEDFLSPERNKSSNSPLKLFGNHDTFTTNKLHRRISQLEDSIHQAHSRDGSNNNSAPPSRRTTGSRLASVEEVSITKEQAAMRQSEANGRRTSSIDGFFGQGELDKYQFPEEHFSSSCGDQNEVSEDMPSRSPSPDVMPPGSQQPFRFHVEASPEPEAADTFRGKRKLSRVSAKSTLSITKRSVRGGRPSFPAEQVIANEIARVSSVSFAAEGKRPATSPFKNPTPKRRRTLVQIEVQEPSIVSIHETHRRFQSAIGKRKDARYDSRSNLADPEVLANRTILRPRNPTPSQRRRQEIEDEILDVAEEFVSSSPRLEAIREHLSVPSQLDESRDLLQARAVASEVALFSERVAHGMKDDGRKRSVTTQDFLDEAMKIMSFIRSKGRPTSNLGSVVEFESEMPSPETAPVDEDQESPLSLSRPPTREGMRSGWRSRDQEDVDPQVLDHLRRFQEQDDDAFSSLRSSQVVKEANRPESQIHTLESHPPGIHIIERSPRHRSPRRSRSNSNFTRDGHGSTGTDPQTHSSRTSADSSLGRTTTSRKSDNVATLGPDAVAHLIPEEVAGMTFDRVKGVWTKARSPNKQRVNEEPSSLTQSENDPFDNIPDLTVDELEETRHLLLAKSGSGTDINSSDGSQPQLSETSAVHRHVHMPLKPVDTDSHLSSTPSKASHDTSTAKDNTSTTRATSVSHKAPTPAITAAPETKPNRRTQQPKPEEDVEHEIQIHEGRSTTKQSNLRHELNGITVSITSPTVSGYSSNQLTPPRADAATSRIDFAEKPSDIPARLKPQGAREMSLSVRVSGALATADVDGRELSQIVSSPYKADMTFYMSDLPDFTVNQIDERELPDRTVMMRTGKSRVRAIEDRFASGNHLLVKGLQDVEPEEPFWEDLRQVDLHGKSLTSLHLLDLLCERLEKVNVADNDICQLGGAPSTIRCMSAQGNQLTGLTSWGHLTNLQYLDVSNNQIESLEGLSSLIHLRELRADNNKIGSLDGIAFLDGLLTLSLKNNIIEQVDFGETEL
jgi:hypothetical protein